MAANLSADLRSARRRPGKIKAGGVGMCAVFGTAAGMRSPSLVVTFTLTPAEARLTGAGRKVCLTHSDHDRRGQIL